MKKYVLALALASIFIAQVILAQAVMAQAVSMKIDIDIKPESPQNSINMKGKGTIPVAILSSTLFDAPSMVDVNSLTFGRTGTENSLAFCGKGAEDVNGDALLDLVCHFYTQRTGFQSRDTEGVLKGTAFVLSTSHLAVGSSSSVEIVGTDSVQVVSVQKIAVISDIGGRGDMSFNDMAFKGGDEAERDFGVEMIELVSNSPDDYVPNLEKAARDRDVILIAAVGFLLMNAVIDVASRYPDKNFLMIDGYIPGMDNVMSIRFEEHKGSAIVGAIAALTAVYYRYSHVGAVLGVSFPVLWTFEIGYKWGVDWALEYWYPTNFGEQAPYIGQVDQNQRVLYTYTGTFSDIYQGYLAARSMYQQDAVAVYNIAGPLGFGINEAVKEMADPQATMGPPFWIGVDADQDWINPGFVLASMMKRVDRAVYFGTQLVLEGTFRQVVLENNGIIILGIGTAVSGIPMEGISVSTLDDLDEFIQMGIDYEERTGTPILPMPPEDMRARIAAMRNTLPEWVWAAAADLTNAIRNDPDLVPYADTWDEVQYWRNIFG